MYVTAGGAGKALYDFPVPDTYEGQVADRESVDTYHVVKGGGKAAETVEWSRVRCTGFSFLAVEVRPGRHKRMKVTALAESGERIDHFEISRADRPSGRSGDRPVQSVSVTRGATVVPAVEGALEGGGGIAALRLGRAGGVTDTAGSRLDHDGSTP